MSRGLREIVAGLDDYATWTRHAQERGADHALSIDIHDMDAELLDEAATELKRLKAALEEIAAMPRAFAPHSPRWPQDVADAALGQ